MAKVLEFQLQRHSFQRNPRADLLQNGLVGSPCSPGDSQESSPTPQFKRINSLTLSLLHRVQLFERLLDYILPGCSAVGFSRQEYWSGLPCPPPGDLPDSGIKPVSLVSLALAGRFFTTSATWEAQNQGY